MICESIDRVARITYFGTKIEYELEQAGMALLAADEGIDPTAVPGLAGACPRKRATPVLTRRVKQARRRLAGPEEQAPLDRRCLRQSTSRVSRRPSPGTPRS